MTHGMDLHAAQVAETLEDAARAARACTVCAAHLPRGPRPVLVVRATARILLIGQAPGTRVHETGIPWNDRSGDRLRAWMGIDRDRFYDPERIAILPMGLCYPGVDAHGGDKPPRPECAPLWHPRIRPHLRHVTLTLLIGAYAQAHGLHTAARAGMTETVAAWRDFAPAIVPLPHPSWRNTAWIARNPWFTEALLPELRARVQEALGA